jgi:hypothetical protein
MSAGKMLVVGLAKTKAVLAGATRTAGDIPAIGDLVGPGLLVRTKDDEATLMVPVEELEVKEVDFAEEVFHDPAAHTVDDRGMIAAASLGVVSANLANGSINVVVAAGPVPADKNVLVVIDAGPNQEALRFSGITTLNQVSTSVPISGVPFGRHIVLASVNGYRSLVEPKDFT